MVKNLKEKREIEVDMRRTVCDVCGGMLKEGDVKLRLGVSREEPNQYDLPGLRKLPEPIDICSVNCLKENLNGLILILQSKVIPALPSLSEDVTDERKYLSQCNTKEAAASPSFSLGAAAASIKLRSF